jgi:hypothetical protein
MLQAWLSYGYIVLLAILVFAFVLWRRRASVLAIAGGRAMSSYCL